MRRNWTLAKSLVVLALALCLGCNSDKPTEPSQKAPSVETSAVSAITPTSASCGGEIISDGDATITSRGVCWSTGLTPTTADAKTSDGAGAGSFVSTISGLSVGTQYYVRAYATNGIGTGYGMAMSFTTLATFPTVSTDSVSAINQDNAICGGNVDADGGSPVTARGTCWSTTPNPTVNSSKSLDGAGLGKFSSNIIGLVGNTTYFVRAYATNTIGTSYGSTKTFKSSPVLPTIVTTSVGAISQTSAQCGGEVTADGGSDITARGVCWNTVGDPTLVDNNTSDGTGLGGFASSLSGLSIGTIYYVRAYASNSVGTTYGTNRTFRTVDSTGTVTDVDGRVYSTVKIGAQWWMSENLKVQRYRNGDDIPRVESGPSWGQLNSGAMCVYDNEISNYVTYGALYNSFAVSDGRDIAPVGWHVPTQAEWQALVDYLGGEMVAGTKLKETGNTHWLGGYPYASNESGFNALPGGFRNFDGSVYYALGNDADFWTSTPFDTMTAWGFALYNTDTEVHSNYADKRFGASIRCVKD